MTILPSGSVSDARTIIQPERPKQDLYVQADAVGMNKHGKHRLKTL
jgi:hypothetical protein